MEEEDQKQMGIESHPKVAIFSSSDMAGAENMLQRFMENIDSDFKKNIILIFPEKGKFSGICDKIGVQYKIIKFTPIKSNFLEYMKCTIILTRYLSKHKFDLLDCNGLTLSQVCAPLAIILGVPLVVHAHDACTGRFTLFILRYLSRFYSKFRLVAVSKFVRNEFVKFGVKAASIDTIYNGIGERQSSLKDKSDMGAFRSQYNFSGTDILIVIIGRLTQWKRQHVFIRAAEYFKSYQNIKFLIIGDGRLSVDPDYSKMLYKTVEDNLLTNVHFLGWVDDIDKSLSEIDILVSLSNDEPFGLTMIEAMVHMVPLIGTRSGAIPELIIDQYNGLLVESDNVEQLCEAIIKLAYSKIVREQYGENGYQFVTTKFGIERHVACVLKLYRQLYHSCPIEFTEYRGHR